MYPPSTWRFGVVAGGQEWQSAITAAATGNYSLINEGAVSCRVKVGEGSPATVSSGGTATVAMTAGQTLWLADVGGYLQIIPPS